MISAGPLGKGVDLEVPNMSLILGGLVGYAEHVLLNVKCRNPGDQPSSTSTFQVFVYIMSTNTPLAKASHIAKAKDKRWEYVPSPKVEEERVHICSKVT